MRLGRITQLSEKKDDLPTLARLARDAAQENLRRQYAKGLEDGTLITLDMIEGKVEYGGVAYDGPLPDELRDWIARVRANAKSEEGRP